MAADQRRKRLSGASIVGCSSLEKFRAKNRNSKKPQNGFHTKSNISLEWDGSHKRVVAKRDQLGISRRSLMPFTDFAPGFHTALADVITLPHEIFELEDLSEILSYEVWQTHLSENERNFLRQFLPVGAESEHILDALLDLENLHFGNPLSKWGTSVCSGHLHPDAIIFLERSLKAEKKAYYSNLQKYHDDLILHLQNLKKKWENCKDPEREILQKMWRPRKDAVDRVSSQVNECKHGILDQDLTASSESNSCIGDDEECSSDNQNPSVVKGEFQASDRMPRKFPVKDKSIVPSTAETRGEKGEKMQKRNSPSNDSSRYMSYVKISKKQHELLKNMKQSGKSIQSRSLNRVLGDVDSLNVQPYEEFMEEERRKLHEHWSRLTKQDLAVFHANWKELQSQKQRIFRALEKDLQERIQVVLEDGENTENLENYKSTMVIDFGICNEQKESLEDVVQNEMENTGVLMELDASVEERENPENVFRVEEIYDAKGAGSNMHDDDDDDSIPLSPEYGSPSSPEQVPSIGNSNACNHMDLESETIHMSDPAEGSEHSGEMITDDATANQDVPLPGVENVWARDGMPHGYHDSVKSHEYTSTAALSLSHQPSSEGPRMQLIGLESQLPDVRGAKVLLHAHPNDSSSFGYPDQDRNDHLLQSLFKDQRILSYHNEQSPTGLNFQPPKAAFPGNGQFPGHFAEQSQLSLELREQRQQNQVYVQQSFPSDGDRYLIPRQGPLISGNVQTWVTNSVPLPRTTPFQHQLRPGDILGQNWFPSEPQVRNRWTSSDVDIPGQSSGDQSLFSVLSHCNQLRTGNPYDSMSSSEQFISPRNYRLMATGTPGMSSNLQQSGHPLDYLGGRDATTSMMPDDIGWMNLPHQNSGMHDPLGKPFLRSWNQ